MLTEYQACNQAVLSSATRCWQSVSVIVGGSFAAVGLLFRFDRPSILTSWVIIFAGTAGAIALVLLDRFVRREKWRQEVHFLRLRQIEETLGMRAFWDIHVLDNWKKAEKQLSNSDRRDNERYRDLKTRRVRPFGWRFIRYLIWLAVMLWGITALTQISILLGWAGYFRLIDP